MLSRVRASATIASPSAPGSISSVRSARPRGVLPVAVAFCRFNPIHGQGMSSAAKQALLLQDVLSWSTAEPDPIAAVQAGFMAEVASVLETP
jgi:hypothetical protein